MEVDETLLNQAKAAKAAARKLAGLSTAVKNRALESIAESLVSRQDEILAANTQDVERARDSGLAEAPLNSSSNETGRVLPRIVRSPSSTKSSPSVRMPVERKDSSG